MKTPQSSWMKFFFSTTGRTTRKQYWLYCILLLGVPAGLIAAAIDIALGYEDKDGPGGLVFVLVLWPAIAISVKRWHDRDKSGWWVLIGLIPIIGTIWALIENGFLRGTSGDNRFGQDPLAGAA